MKLTGNQGFASIILGFHSVSILHKTPTEIHVRKSGKLIFEGSAHIGRGSILVAQGKLTIGDNFSISASSQVYSFEDIKFGRDIQFSWECLVMDSDTHVIYDEDGNRFEPTKPIIFGDKIWIGCRATILKGTVIPSNCVIGACSLVSGSKFEPNTIIAGVPARSTKKIGGFKI